MLHQDMIFSIILTNQKMVNSISIILIEDMVISGVKQFFSLKRVVSIKVAVKTPTFTVGGVRQ